MAECKYSQFGLDVKMALLKSGKTQNWLIDRVKEETGLYFDDSYLYKILTGQRKAKEIVDVISSILGVKDGGG